MTTEDFMMKFILALMLAAFALFFIVACLGMTDSLTLEDIGEKSVPCIDERNRPFEDEMCVKTITCSYLGFVGDKKCSDVKGGLDE